MDTIAGTSGDDTINALTVNGTTGDEATTIGTFDVVDGGAGTDTLNIYTDTDLNEVQRGTFKNIETVNIYNATAGDEYQNVDGDLDASKFEGATQVWQNGTAVDVVNLAATTTAGFATAQASDLNVAAAATAASATVALDDVADADTSNGNDINLNFSGAALNTVTVTGTLAAGTDVDESQSLDIDVVVGEDETTLTVNTAIDATLTFDDAGSTDKVNTINAAASAGGISFAGNDEVVSLTTGAGEDTVTLSTVATDDGVAASVTTGEGDDVITVTVDGDGFDDVTTTVSAGAGDDEIEINTADTALSVDAGAGDDTVTLTLGLANVATTDVIGGGAGTDTVVVAGATLVAEDYILLTEVVTAFEAIEFITTAADIDASRMSNYKDITFAAVAANAAEGVANDQAITLKADDAGAALTVTADGYDATDVDAIVYAGTLDVTVDATAVGANVAAVDAFASAINLKVTATTGDLTVDLTGDLETATVTLTNVVNEAGDDMFEASLNLTTGEELGALTTLTLAGNGKATVVNTDTTDLVTINASALDSTTWDGVTDTAVAGTGLDYTSSNTKAETITLGDGIDALLLTASTVLKTDTITGLNLVATEANADVIDTDLSDILSVVADGGAVYESVGEIEAGSLNLALVNVAALADKDNTIFEFAGNTYIFTTADDIVNDTDGLIKISGTVDHDLLINSLGIDLVV